MTLKNTDERWGAVSQLFHWLIVVLILVMAYLGLTMGDLPNGPRKIDIYALHKSIGLTILALVVLRVLWRVYAGAPAPVPGTPAWQQRIASVTRQIEALADREDKASPSYSSGCFAGGGRCSLSD